MVEPASWSCHQMDARCPMAGSWSAVTAVSFGGSSKPASHLADCLLGVGITAAESIRAWRSAHPRLTRNVPRAERREVPATAGYDARARCASESVVLSVLTIVLESLFCASVLH
jgi:hypothetical protein